TMADVNVNAPAEQAHAMAPPIQRMWEEFTQSIHYFVEDKKNLALHTQGKKKAHPIVIPSISNKGTKREVFGMPIPNELITADIRGEQYYKEYLEKVAKHQRYLASEEGSDPDSPASKPAKATKKSKPSAPKATPASESTVSQQPKPKPAPAKTQEKKHKLVAEKSDEPSPAKSSKPSKVTKRRKPTSSLSLVDEFVDEGHAESPLIYAKLGLTDSDTESGKEMPPVVKIGAQDEGQARPNPGVLIEGQAGSNPGDDAEPQPQSNPIVHAGPDFEHMDLEATDVSTQQNPEQMDEGFTATAYPNVQENLKLTVEEHVILEAENEKITT
nr:E-beta-farnesene synthase [Tanacetum cinerariifolium]